MTFIEIKNVFLEYDGKPDNEKVLDNYINFLLSYKYNGNDYTESHHIFPNATYKKHFDNDNYIIILKYSDHIKAHELLFEAYNKRVYQRPLQFMKSPLLKNSKLISNAAKKGWINLKKDKNKFDLFKKHRSDYMKALSSEEQGRRSKLGWESGSEDDYKRRCKIAKERWTDERKSTKSIQQKEYCKNNRDKICKIAQDTWDNKTLEERESFRKTMQKVNNDTEVCKRRGDSNKKNWESEEFRNNMLKRKRRSKVKYKLTSPTDKVIIYVDGLHSMCKEYNFDITIIRKFRNTGNRVFFVKKVKRPSEKVSNTIGWKFETIEKIN